ncbi:MAG: cobaltochelatase subunit CobN [Methanothermobacter sp.]|nr:cobaltochelatase subunit CobN [Methanothermobacter sp.]
MDRQVILVLASIVLLVLTGTVSAADNATNDTNSTEVHFLVISWDTSAGQYQIPAERVSKDYPNVKFQIRSVSQANQNLSEIPKLIEWSHIIYLNNLQQGALSDTILNLNATGKLQGKTVIAEPAPYYCFPIVRLTNINGTRFVDRNGTALTDQQIQQIYTAISYSSTPLQLIAGLQRTYPSLYSLLEVRKYWCTETASIENREQMFRYILATVYPEKGFTYNKPVPVSQYALYRDGKLYTNFTEYSNLYFKPEVPGVGIVAWMSTTWEKGDLKLFDKLIEELENRGFNVMVLFAQGNPVSGVNTLQGVNEYFIDNKTNKSRVDVIINFTWLVGGETSRLAIDKLLETYNILVFQPITSSKNENTWNISEGGDWSTANTIALKETQGQIAPIIVATTETITCPDTGLALSLTKPIEERGARLAETVKNWIKLRYLPNSQKKVALIYYNYPPGKQNIASADSLNGPESILTILNLLKENGYNITGIPTSLDELVEMLITKGVNIAAWAPGELEKLAENATLYPVDKFMAWYQKLPEITRKEMEEGPFGYIECIAKEILTKSRTAEFIDTANTIIDNWYKKMVSTIDQMKSTLTKEQLSNATILLEKAYEVLKDILQGNDKLGELQAIKNSFITLRIPGLSGWGPPPGNIMTIEKNGTKYFIIPGMILGNIFLGPQPQRGYTDASILYHSIVVPPPYQYLAFYAYLQEEFKADAVIHLGRHGTYEWLPGKDLALSSADYPDICIGAMPSIYIYTMDGVGEALHAKRRGLAVIISHLTQPFALNTLNDDLLALKALTERYMASTEETQKQQLFEMIKEFALKLQLNTFIDLNGSPEEMVDSLHDYIIELQSTTTPLGLHVFGRDWTLEQVTALATTMAEKINCIGIGQNQFISPAKAIQTLPLNLTDIIEKFYTGTEPEKVIEEIQKTIGRNLTETETQGLQKIYEYTHNISISPKREREMLIRALNGGYIPPSLGNDPVRTPDALPTGGNLYGLDPQKLPYWDAYLNGKKMAEEALKAYETTPEQLGVILWATETQRDNGGTIGFILHLLGLEPIYQQQAQHSGNVIGIKAIPLKELGRPRIDTIVTISGIFREIFPQCVQLLDRAFRTALATSYNTLLAKIANETMAKELKMALDASMETIKKAGLFNPGDEPLEMNYIAQHWLEDTRKLLEAGVPADEASKMAITRIFGPPIGEWGAKSVREGPQLAWTWNDRLELADYYIHDMQYAYREDEQGTPLGEVFQMRLADVQGIYHSRSTNVRGILDLDHNYEFLGGFSIAVEKIRGKTPQLFILNQIEASKPAVETLAKFINRDLQTKLFNPQWIKEMMAQGPAGASYISGQFIDNMVGWKVLRTDAITNEMWNNIVDIYIKDKYNIGVANWLSTGSNAYSMIDITGKLLTMAHKGYWQTDTGTLSLVANTWASLISNYGVSCCDCSCGNIAMMQWAMQYINPNLLEAVKARLYGATMNGAFAPTGSPGIPSQPGTPGVPGQPGSPGSVGHVGGPTPGYIGSPGTGSQASAGSMGGIVGAAGAIAGSDAGPGTGKVYEVSKSSGTAGTPRGLPVYAIVGVIILVALVGAGYFLAGPGKI